MVTLQILVLSFLVRIRVSQLIESISLIIERCFFYVFVGRETAPPDLIN